MNSNDDNINNEDNNNIYFDRKKKSYIPIFFKLCFLYHAWMYLNQWFFSSDLYADEAIYERVFCRMLFFGKEI